MNASNINVSFVSETELSVPRDNFAVTYLSEFDRMIFIFINRIILSTIVGLFGMFSNVINIWVFVKQGLNTSINVSFLAMAFSDLFRIVTVHWMNVCSNPFIDNLDAPFVFVDIQYLTGGWPTGCANRITLCITAYVTIERCLCIAAPLKVKKIITTNRTIASLVLISVINTLGLVPEYASVYFDWKLFPAKNRSLLALAFRSSRPQTQGISFTIHAIILTLGLLTVIVFTSILVLQLKHHGKWRKQNTSSVQQRDNFTSRDQKTVKMVITIATVMVTCYAPAVGLSLVSAVVPDFSVTGRQVNLFHALWSFGYLLGIVNASINIFIYYNMSSSYKDICEKYRFRCCEHKKS